MLISRLRVVMKKEAVTGVTLVAGGKQRKGFIGIGRRQAEVAMDSGNW